MEPPSTLRKVAIVGTGVIGSGWAALFLAKGYHVVAFVRSPASQTKFLKSLEEAYRNFVARGIALDPDGYKAVACVFNLAECVADADYVQESVVEDLALKQLIVQEIDQFAPPNVIIGSSTSFIPLSLLRWRARKHPERVATAHPSLPQWDAFCEVLGSSPAITAWLAKLYGVDSSPDITGLGMDVVAMKREAHGHVMNSLLSSLSMTGVLLVQKGICEAADVDATMVHLGRLMVASGGISGAVVGFVGGGSSRAAADISVDIMLGLPLGMAAEWNSRLLPKFLARPSLWLLQLLFGPLRLFKFLVRRAVARFNGPFYKLFDESPAGIAAFEASAVQRICTFEALASGAKPKAS